MNVKSSQDEPGKVGLARIEDPLCNKGTAFSKEERRRYRLEGLLPPHIETLDEQVQRAYEALSREADDLAKHIYLRQLQDTNETLFYRLLLERISETMPLIYTPTVGAACQRFSHIYQRARGLFIAYPNRDAMDTILSNVDREIDVIVVTDGERILGLGDQGAGGMGIPIGKLSLYSLCGGIHPARTLPITLDLGTNNPERMADPSYIGWRHERIKGDEYDDFIERFVAAVTRRFPNVLLQWEDFASADAERILAQYRNRLCTFNDDIQGTAAVATGTILAAIEAVAGKLNEQRFAILGAGSAGLGISGQLIRTMVAGGMSTEEARRRFYVINRGGLLHEGRTDLAPLLRELAQPTENLASWDCNLNEQLSFEDVVRNAQPTVLLGVTGQGGAFTESIVRTMASHAPQPIIFPLSNPTSRAEATPADLLEWTEGKAIVATGSPFEPVDYRGSTHVIPQCNNSYVFPAMGLGVLAAKASRVTDGMFMAAAIALKEKSPALVDPNASLLPQLEDIREVSRHIATAVALQAQDEGVAKKVSFAELGQRIDHTMWSPAY